MPAEHLLVALRVRPCALSRLSYLRSCVHHTRRVIAALEAKRAEATDPEWQAIHDRHLALEAHTLRLWEMRVAWAEVATGQRKRWTWEHVSVIRGDRGDPSLVAIEHEIRRLMGV